MPAGEWLDSPVIDYFVREFEGGTREAAVRAMQLPGFKGELEALGAHLYTDADGRLHAIFPFRSTDQACWKVVEAAVGPESSDRTGGEDRRRHGKDYREAADGGPAPIPEEIVERAVQLHVEKGYGRRRLDNKIPGLTEYQAGQVLSWFRVVGKPAGLWLEDGRLKWGKAISTTPAGLRLPRL
jgi:hypothetical protein